jgi:tetratricopeptide (TPR) repeat protein
MSEPIGTLEVALAHTARLLDREPALAAAQAGEILKAIPDHPAATLLLGVAQRRARDPAKSLATLRALIAVQPHWAQAHYEFGISLGVEGDTEAAVRALRHAVSIKPDMPDAWRALADRLAALDDLPGAQAAYAEQIRHSTQDPRLMEAAAYLCAGRLAPAEALLRAQLKQFPTDVAAMRMLAEVASRLGRYADAQALLARALELAPTFVPARHNYAFVLHRAGKSVEALAQLDHLLTTEPEHAGYLNLKAAVLARIGEVEEAIRIYERVTARYPTHAKIWMSFGHALKTAGRQDQAVDAYRKSIALSPQLGEAWWSLANMKTVAFDAEDRANMQRQLEREDITEEDRFHFHFALGKAFEDASVYVASFEHYACGNALRREIIAHDPAEDTEHVQRSMKFFRPEVFAARSGSGCPAADPIFIVGLPRAGSTLIEQILASHPLVEGTQELPDLAAIARELGGKKSRTAHSSYPEILAELSDDRLRQLGERYLEQTRIQRKTTAPFFIDKLPNNWAHVGLIHLILPNAKIIDARRHPLGCCFSGFKQHFARGQHFSYDLSDLGHYYREYVQLMAHFDRVLPGRVHRVIYEDMIEDTEREIRQMLDYCGLEFDERCLRFYENDRAVRTASSEQVRRPIFREGVDHWRHYDRWLAPLREALGSVLDSYPAVPDFFDGPAPLGAPKSETR